MMVVDWNGINRRAPLRGGRGLDLIVIATLQVQGQLHND